MGKIRERTGGGGRAREGGSPDGPWRVVGAALIGTAVVAAGLLVWKHFSGQSLPGCGPQSACGELEKTVFGRVPGTAWPISFVGFGWFAALLFAWLRSPSPSALLWPSRISAVASLFYLVVMASLGKLCWYCLIAHLANLAFALYVHRASRGRAAQFSGMQFPWMQLAIPFVAVTAVLAPLEWRRLEANRERAELSAAETARRVEEQARAGTDAAETSEHDHAAHGEPGFSGSTTPVDTSSTNGTNATDTISPSASTATSTTSTEAAEAATETPTPTASSGFTGRYRKGPERSPYRLVVFSDFQCRDCQRVAREIAEVRAVRSDISLSAKHFPMCKDCNPHMGGQNIHANACWAARAVEAAGILKGNDGYWAMYDWLYARGGTFVDAELVEGVRTLGYDPEEFQRVMMGPETLRLVQQDIEEAVDQGIHYTPLVFLNGVELRGWESPGTVKQTLLALDASVPAKTAAADKPVGAASKYVDDWRVQRPRPVAVDQKPHWFGPGATAKARVVVFGDYQSAHAARLDSLLQVVMKSRPQVSYSLRHFPGDPSCNPKLTQTFSPQGCLAARAAEAAGVVGGEEGYAKMHAWLFDNQDRLSQPGILAGAGEIGLDREAFTRALADPAVDAAIKEDVDAATRAGVTQLPQVYVNGKWLPRWFKKGERIMETILDEAAR